MGRDDRKVADRGRAVAAALSILVVAVMLGSATGVASSSTAAVSQAGTSGGTITLDGRPVFLIGTWGQCAADVERNLALGVNLFVGSLCDERALADRIDGRAWMIQSITTPETLAPSIGFLQPDEPDVNGIPATALEPPRGNGKLTILDVSMNFWDGSHRPGVDYPALFRKGDVLSTNVYPIGLNCDREPWVTVETPYDVQLQLAALGKPSGQWLEVNHLDGNCGEHLTPAIVEAEAWLAVEGGATWIGWFLPEGDHGGYETFDIRPPIADSVTAIDAELTELAPVLLAPRLDITTPWGNGKPSGLGSNPIKVGARSYAGRVYLFATNSTAGAVSWSRALPGLAADASVRRENGSGTLTAAKGGVLADRFEPYETKIYSWVPAAQAAPTAPAPTTVTVELGTGSPVLRPSVLPTAGRTTLVVRNLGPTGRTLAVHGPGGRAQSIRVAGGAQAKLKLALVPGTYRFTESPSGRTVQRVVR